MRKLLPFIALLVATPLSAQEVIELAPGDSIEVQRVSPLLIRALTDTMLVRDTLPPVQDTLPPVQDTLPPVQLPPVQDTLPPVQDTLPPYQDTTFVDGCPDEWTCTPPTPLAPTMYVAGWADTIPGATENGLWVAWDAMPADSFRVTGERQDGTDPFEAIVPGSDTTHIHLLFYDTVTPMRGCVSAFLRDLEGPEACDEFEWAPMVQGQPSIRLVWGESWGTRQERVMSDGAVLPSLFWWGVVTPDPQPANVECFIDGNFQRRESSAPWDCRGSPTPGWPLSVGEHTFTVRLLDASGAVIDERTVTATVQ